MGDDQRGESSSVSVSAAGAPRLIESLKTEIALLRARIGKSARYPYLLEDALSDARARVGELRTNNAQLAQALRDVRQQFAFLKAELTRFAHTARPYAIVVEALDDGTVNILVSGRKMRVAVSPDLFACDLQPGQEVLLDDEMNVIAAQGFERAGSVVSVKRILEGADRVLVTDRADFERVVLLAGPLSHRPLRVGDSLMVGAHSGFAYERIPKAEIRELILERVPDTGYVDIGGLAAQIDVIRDAVELPFLHARVFHEHQLTPPKGVLLYGPPGCGKTLIAKAVANSLGRQAGQTRDAGEATSYFLSVKGPELLDKYVGEAERRIRLVFQRAREKAARGLPVIVFFDEIDSVFRTRGSGVSSDFESTLVPQMLVELDGVQKLDNVIVIGASNRVDMIDPALLRPGRLDVKIKIDRPGVEAACDIFSKYVTRELPLHPAALAQHNGDRDRTVEVMIRETVDKIYSHHDDNRFVEVTYRGGDKEVIYFYEFMSGASIRNIVDRAKRMAIKDMLGGGQRGLRSRHLIAAYLDELRENEDLPNTANPDDWARISGKRGKPIASIRTLVSGRGRAARRGLGDRIQAEADNH